MTFASPLAVKSPPKVSIYLRSGSSYYQPVEAANGKLKPLVARVNGTAQRLPKGVYCLRHQVNGQRKWSPVGIDPQLAMVKKIKLEATLAAQAAGVMEIALQPAAVKPTGISVLASEYLKETSDHKSHRTYLAYRLTIDSFLLFLSNDVDTLAQVTRLQIMRWIAEMKHHGLDPRTIANRVANLKTFFLHFKTPWLLDKKDRPKYTKKTAKPYTPQELNKLLTHGTADEVDLVMFFYGVGGREQEVQHGRWTDLSFDRKVFSITEKTEKRDAWEWTPKDKEEGDIPLDTVLIERLQKRRERYPDTRLIFPGEDGKPNGHLLRIIKRLALKSGMNCGECVNRKGQSCKTHPVCRRAILHRFRKSFATMHSDAGVNVRTIQKMLRHSSLETTLEYLAASDLDTPEMRIKVNSAFSHLVRVGA